MKTADFYSSATGTLRVNGSRDENAPKGVSLSIDDLSYIKQGSRANEAEPVTDYDLLDNKPQINNVTLTGNKSLNDLGIQSTIDSSHKVSADNIDDTSTTNKFATAAQLAQIQTNENNILTLADSFGTKNLFNVTLDTIKALNTSGTWSNNVFSHDNGGIFTVNNDLTIDVDTTNSTGNNYFWVGGINLNSSKAYVLSGCPSGGAPTTYFIKINDTAFIDTGNSINVAGISAGRLVIGVLANTKTTLTYKPMVCLKTMWDISHTYQPYSLTNAELTAAIQAIQAQLANQ